MSTSQLLELPAELLHHVLTYLDLKELSIAAQTCRAFHCLSEDDRLWHAFVCNELPRPPTSPKPCESWRELYVAHHPYWFLPRSKIWFSDAEPSGKLLVARYDSETGSIVANTVTAVKGMQTVGLWEAVHGVIIHNFDPRVSLDLTRPALKLDLERATQHQSEDGSRSTGQTQPNRYAQEVIMPLSTDPGLFESFMLCRSLPESAIREGTQVWPPLRFPGKMKTRNDSPDNFKSLGHRPTRASEVSQHNFRLHKWVEYNGRRTSANTVPRLHGLTADLGFNGPFYAGGGMNYRFPESINTFATLPEWCYTPTPEKPWQGIWCGDYSGHGCEILLITQPDQETVKPLPEDMDWLRPWLEGSRRGSISSNGGSASAAEDWNATVGSADMQLQAVATRASTADDPTPSGRLEAIKLTGDPNIPRGEYTFIAPDIGPTGLVRLADEHIFRGARIVRSAGHIAGRGFREAQWTPSQLIMVSHDCLGQFWEGFGHISFYHRVDLEALLRM